MNKSTNDKNSTNPQLAHDRMLGCVCDYLGNEIKEGMTIKIIRTKPIWSEMQMWVTTGNGKMEKRGETVKAPEKIWECIGEWPVVRGADGNLRYIVDYGSAGSIHWLLSKIDWGRQKQDLIAIKGVSDTEPENAP